MFVPHMAEEFLEPSIKHFVSIKTLPFPMSSGTQRRALLCHQSEQTKILPHEFGESGEQKYLRENRVS